MPCAPPLPLLARATECACLSTDVVNGRRSDDGTHNVPSSPGKGRRFCLCGGAADEDADAADGAADAELPCGGAIEGGCGFVFGSSGKGAATEDDVAADGAADGAATEDDVAADCVTLGGAASDDDVAADGAADAEDAEPCGGGGGCGCVRCSRRCAGGGPAGARGTRFGLSAFAIRDEGSTRRGRLYISVHHSSTELLCEFMVGSEGIDPSNCMCIYTALFRPQNGWFRTVSSTVNKYIYIYIEIYKYVYIHICMYMYM